MASVAAPPNRSDHLGVLVLGVGGNVSQGILKALRRSTLEPRVVTACVSALSTGLYLEAGPAYVSPIARDDDFMPWLVETCRAEGIGAVLSGTEPVLEVLAEHRDRLQAETGAIAVVSPPATLAVGADKLVTADWLRENGLNHPASVSAGDVVGLEALLGEHGLPLIAKPRRGKGSSGVMTLADERDLDWVRGRDDYVVQELLGSEDSEFTIGCFCDSAGELRGVVAMRRELASGTTVSARAGAFDEVAAEAQRIAEALRPLGPLNVQLRMDSGRPVCFELNVRFSGTTPIRARLGFNEVDAALRHFVLGEDAVNLPEITSGVALRYWNEVYVDDGAVEELAAAGRLDAAASRSRGVEDLGMGA